MSVTTATLIAWDGAAELTPVAMSPDAATATAASTPTEPAISARFLHLPSLKGSIADLLRRLIVTRSWALVARATGANAQPLAAESRSEGPASTRRGFEPS